MRSCEQDLSNTCVGEGTCGGNLDFGLVCVCITQKARKILVSFRSAGGWILLPLHRVTVAVSPCFSLDAKLS